MIAFLNGIVAEKNQNEIVLDVGGVGYQLACSMNTLQLCPPVGQEMKAYTFLNIREDAVDLFGFATREEKSMFLRLTGVSGVGPRTALALLGSMPLKDLTLAIVMEDVTSLSRAPGIGKKTAQRIALELKDKVSENDFGGGMPASSVAPSPAAADGYREALAALQSLGYTGQEAARALNGVKDQSDQADELVRLALRSMAF